MTTIDKKVAERVDYSIIAEWIEPGSRILDLGCGNGELLSFLIETKNVKGMGIELSPGRVIECTGRGIPVVNQDLNLGMSNFKSQSFDYVILSQTLQVMHHPQELLSEMLRVGKYGMVSFPNFAYHAVRLNLLFSGKMPKSKIFPFEWYDTPNIHNITIKDFKSYCRESGVEILKKYTITHDRYYRRQFFPNFFAEGAVALLTKSKYSGITQ